MKHVRSGEVPEPQGRVDYIGSQNETKKPKKLWLLDIFMDLSTTTRVAAGMGRIFTNENITSYSKDLFRKANDTRKDQLIISAWSTDGTIFVKTSPERAPLRVYVKEDLENL